MMRAAFALALLAMAAGAQSASKDEAAVRELVRRYVDARETIDPKATESLFIDDADQLVSSGEWRRGRAVLVKGAMASSRQNEGKRTITVESVRFVTPEVAIADGRYDLAQSSGEMRRMWTTLVCVRRSDGWRIAAIRNMLPSAQR